jgi:hypothetical protein
LFTVVQAISLRYRCAVRAVFHAALGTKRWVGFRRRNDGIASFDRIRHQRHDASVFLYAFDLLELDGDDLRRDLTRSAQGHAGRAGIKVQ